MFLLIPLHGCIVLEFQKLHIIKILWQTFKNDWKLYVDDFEYTND